MKFKNLKVLVVDDFQLARTLLIDILNGIGFEQIDEADDGAAALHQRRAKPTISTSRD